MPYLNHIVDATQELKYQCVLTANKMNRIRNLQCSNSIFVYCSLPYSQHHAECDCACVHRVFNIPTIIHFVETVCGIFYDVFCSLSTLQCNVSFTCQKRLLFAFVTWCWSADQPNEFMCINRIHHSTHIRAAHIVCRTYHVLLELLHVKVMLKTAIRIYSLAVDESSR